MLSRTTLTGRRLWTFFAPSFSDQSGVSLPAAPVLNALRKDGSRGDVLGSKPGATWNVNGDHRGLQLRCVRAHSPTTKRRILRRLLGWHVDGGKLGAVVLDGLNVVMSFYSLGM
jgi:hypothetical protein